MKRFVGVFVLAVILLAAVMATATGGPYLVANPMQVTLSAGQTLTFNVQGLPSSISAANIPADPTGTYAFALDISSLPAVSGGYTVTATACLNDPVWGQKCSAASSPFSFNPASAPPIPSGLGLSVKQ
jgi:hypothetical protein